MCKASEKQEHGGNTQNRKRRKRFLVWITSVVIGLILLVTIIGHFWLVPARISRDVKRNLLKFWDGPVIIGDIEVNYFDPVYLSTVRFFDKTGRECLHTGRVKMIFTKWPGMHPVVTEIEIEKLNFRISAPVSKITLPVVFPPRKSLSQKKRFKIRKFTINDAEITIAAAQGSLRIYQNLQLFVNKNNDLYDFLLKRVEPASSESLLVKGTIDSKNLETELSMHIQHAVKKLEMSLIFKALNISGFSAGGNLAADLTISGCLKQPAGLKTEGTINLDGWTLAKNYRTIAENLTTIGNAKDRRFEFRNITADICKGIAAGFLSVEIRQDAPTVFNGQILAQRMDFVELTSVLGGSARKATRGSVTFNYNFSAEVKNLQSMVGQGQIFLDDADITVIPIVPYIFRIMGLSQFSPLGMSDAGCTFTTAGPVLTIDTAYVADFLAAIKAESGGSINLKTKQINMYVIAMPIKQIDAVISPIPIVNIFANLKDKLIRLRVSGSWSDPPAQLITKEPIEDVKKAAVDFFRDVIETGGWITQPILKGFGIFPEHENSE